MVLISIVLCINCKNHITDILLLLDIKKNKFIKTNIKLDTKQLRWKPLMSLEALIPCKFESNSK